ncbi:hypothetical protein Tco_1175074 [Tanacetum coccineum]
MKLSFVENLIAILPSAELMFLTYALELGLLDGLEVGVESRDIVKLKIHAGNPQQFDWLLRRVLDPTAQKMRLGGSYDWKDEIEGLETLLKS